MFVGAQVHQKDDNNRIRIPQVFRAELGTSFYFVMGGSGVVHIYTQEHVDELFTKLNQKINHLNPKEIKAAAKYSSGFKHVNEDKQGRVTIPDGIVKYGKLGRDLMTVGIGNILVMYNVIAEDDEIDNDDYDENMKIISDIMER